MEALSFIRVCGSQTKVEQAWCLNDNIWTADVVCKTFFLFLLAEVLLQCHGGRAASLPQMPAQTQTQTPTPRRGENGGGHQHAHLQRPQTARERDYGLKWDYQTRFHTLSHSEGVCKDSGDKAGGKW